jgi:hypothetical protein
MKKCSAVDVGFLNAQTVVRKAKALMQPIQRTNGFKWRSIHGDPQPVTLVIHTSARENLFAELKVYEILTPTLSVTRQC